MIQSSYQKDFESPLVSRDFSYLSGDSDIRDVVAYGSQISTVNALNDGSPVPPTAEHLKKAFDEGWGASRYVIAKAIGGIEALQDSVGFVVPLTINRWDRTNWIDNGIWLSHMLGSPDSPIMPKVNDIHDAAKLKITPTVQQVANKFGNISVYQDELGFVSRATLNRWDRADWIDNGIWLSHMLGSPEEPVVPTKDMLEQASSVRVGPSPQAVREYFGSMSEYQRALGYMPVRDRKLDYTNWDRETFRLNGIWLSHMLGTPENPIMPRQVDIDKGANLGLCPPRISAFGGFRGSPARYQDALGFVNDYTLDARWTDRDWIDNGIWLSHAGGSIESPSYVGKAFLDKAAQLNIGPSTFRVRQKFGSLVAYQEAIGQHIPEAQASKQMTLRHVLEVGRLLLRREGISYITQPMLAEEGVSPKVVTNRFGTMANLNERLGASDYPNYTKDDVIRHGIAWALKHNDLAPTRSNIIAMSKRHSGPTYRTVQKYFDSPLDYQQAVTTAVTEYKKIRENMVEATGIRERIADFVLRDFSLDEEFAEYALKKGTELNRLCSSSAVNVMGLIEMFSHARITAHWEEYDFYYFGKHIHTRNNVSMNRLLETIKKLDEYGLVPNIDEIEEVFGSVEEFLRKSIEYASSQDDLVHDI